MHAPPIDPFSGPIRRPGGLGAAHPVPRARRARDGPQETNARSEPAGLHLRTTAPLPPRTPRTPPRANRVRIASMPTHPPAPCSAGALVAAQLTVQRLQHPDPTPTPAAPQPPASAPAPRARLSPAGGNHRRLCYVKGRDQASDPTHTAPNLGRGTIRSAAPDASAFGSRWP